MTELTFEDPPNKRGGRTGGKPYGPEKYLDESRQLRERTGEWALFTTELTQQKAATKAQYIREGWHAAFRPAGAFEAVSRTVGNEFRVYVRHLQ